MARSETSGSALTSGTALASGTALWSAQAHMPSIQGRQIVITGGDGAYVTTDAGERLLDATAGLWHANVGHGREDLARAAYEQLQKLETYHVFNRFANDVVLRLADRLAPYAPFADAKVIFGSGGSEAVETACKLARRYWQLKGKGSKKVILSRDFAYHGIHSYGTSIAGIEANREGYGTESLIPETARVDHLDIEKVAERIAEIGAENIAAIVLEPVMGTGGVFPPPAGYLEGVQRLAAENDILIVADEVISGFGRTGTMFACERYGFVPDMVLMAKGITSGYLPLSGILVAPKLWEPFYDGPDAPVYRHGTTYAGHATACAVALAHLDILENEGMLARVRELEGVLDSALDSLRANPFVTDVRIGGLLAGVELAPEIPGDAIADYALEHGVILRVLRGNTLQISPPFVVTDAEIGTIVDTIAAGIAQVGASK
jgi:adenosylmethionine-8-amino-7-oxononanoate aminotransferase